MNTIGAWPGTDVDDKALAHFDDLVRMGKDAGLKTIFKLVVYGIKPFGDAEWDRIWNDTDGTHDLILAGWSRVWLRYKDEPAVFGYDLLNEPARGLDDNYERTQSQRLLPLLRRLTDAMRAISPDKWALYQPLLRKPEDQKTRYRDPVVPIDEPFGRDRVIYAPHLYQMNTSVIGLMLDNLERQARISNAPLLLGEWGSPTRQTTDDNPADQARFTEVYRLTAGEMDRRGIGGIKPWFCGTRRWIPVRGSTGGMTWAIFSDPSPAGRDERGYITDVIVRPRRRRRSPATPRLRLHHEHLRDDPRRRPDPRRHRDLRLRRPPLPARLPRRDRPGPDPHPRPRRRHPPHRSRRDPRGSRSGRVDPVGRRSAALDDRSMDRRGPYLDHSGHAPPGSPGPRRDGSGMTISPSSGGPTGRRRPASLVCHVLVPLARQKEPHARDRRVTSPRQK
jgi:hypothetical protein